MTIEQAVIIAVLITLNAFFVGVEFAIITARRSRLEAISDIQHPAVSLGRRWIEDEQSRHRLVAASQLGITLVSLALGAVAIHAFEGWVDTLAQGGLAAQFSFLAPLLPVLPLLLTLTLVASLHVVLGEQVPKVAVLRAPERFAILAAPVMHVFVIIFGGFIWLLDALTRGVLRLLKLPANGHAHSAVISIDELKEMVSGSEVDGVIADPERELLSAVIDFGELVVRHVSVPRTEVIALEADQPISEAIRLAARSGVTKLPVYEDNLDQIVGILHLRDLLPVLLEQDGLQNRLASELAREALFVPESASVNDLLLHMRARRQHMAITLDEYGGTAGLVTLEDLLEEIVGDVQDPFDTGPLPIQAMPDGTALVDGMSLIEDVNQHFNLNLFDPNYDTLAGYVLGKLGRIAQVGDVVEDSEQGVRLRVDSMDRLRIARVHLARMLPPEPASHQP
jgi:putative hemolysin